MSSIYEEGGTIPEPKPRRKRSIWLRGGFMVFFLVAYSFTQTFVLFIAVIQFMSLLITGRTNIFLCDFGRSLGIWLQQTVAFEAGVTEDMPFPWAPWPKPL